MLPHLGQGANQAIEMAWRWPRSWRSGCTGSPGVAAAYEELRRAGGDPLGARQNGLRLDSTAADSVRDAGRRARRVPQALYSYDVVLRCAAATLP
jgi:hypothetical protein